MYDRTPCRIETWDCTISWRTRPPARIAARTTFHHACLSVSDAFVPPNRTFLSWPSLLRAIGLSSRPTFLKLDIEGGEREWLHAALDSDRALLPEQISFEYHTPRSVTRKIKTAIPQPYFSRLKDVAATAMQMHEMWERGGYTIVHRRDNKHMMGLSDLLMVGSPGAPGHPGRYDSSQ